MKVVINEAQYNRLFNKQKTKLILTESQFNRLMVEEEMMKSLKEVNLNDIIRITKVNDDELHFKVISEDNGRLFLVNGDGAVYKNRYFFITSTSLQNGSLYYDEKPKNEIKDSDDSLIKRLHADRAANEGWKESKFKNIKKFEVLAPDAKTVKFEVDTKSGAPKEPKKKEDFQSSEATAEIEELVGDLNNMREGDDNVFTLNDGNEITFVVTRSDAETVAGEITNATGEYGRLNGKTFEFEASHKNVNFRELNDFDIQIKVFTGKDEEGAEFILEEIIGINDFEDSKSIDIRKEKEKAERDEMVKDFDYEELSELMGEDQILKDFIQKRPAAIFELMNLQRAKGSIPLNKIFAEWGTNIKDGKGSFVGDKFIADNNVIVRFIRKGNVKDSRNKKYSDDFDAFVRNGKKNVGLKVARFKQGDLHPTLKTTINKKVINIEILKALNNTEGHNGGEVKKNDNKANDEFEVLFSIEDAATKKKIEVGYYDMEVLTYNAKNRMK